MEHDRSRPSRGRHLVAHGTARDRPRRGSASSRDAWWHCADAARRRTARSRRVSESVAPTGRGGARRTASSRGLCRPARTSDPDYKAFLYIRELIRRKALPPQLVLLFDLLQSNGPDVRAYDAARTRDLFETLMTLGQRSASVDDVRDAIARANVARAAMRRLLALRRGTPRVSGAEVLPLLGAFWRRRRRVRGARQRGGRPAGSPPAA